MNADSLFKNAIDFSRKTLEKNNEILAAMYIHEADGKVRVAPFVHEDMAKQNKMRKVLIGLVLLLRLEKEFDGMALVSEAWAVSPKKDDPELAKYMSGEKRPAQSSERIDCVSIVVWDRDFERRSGFFRINNVNGVRSLGDKIFDANEGGILETWVDREIESISKKVGIPT